VLEQVLQQLYTDDGQLASNQAVADVEGLQAMPSSESNS
jgi:hypothetical protein